jgi:hypothetical protein
MNKAYRKYYETHRDEILAKMRERDAKRRDEARKYLAEHPEAVDLNREKMRGKYHNWLANKCKNQIEEWLALPDLKAEIRPYLQIVIKEEKYKMMKPKTLRDMAEAFNLNASLL